MKNWEEYDVESSHTVKRCIRTVIYSGFCAVIETYYDKEGAYLWGWLNYPEYIECEEAIMFNDIESAKAYVEMMGDE